MKFRFQNVPRQGGCKPGDVVGAWTCVRPTLDQPSDNSLAWRRNDVVDNAWESVEGPPGRDGRDGESIIGPAGANGRDGVDAALNPRGEYHYGETYRRGDVVRDDDASYMCMAEQTMASPSPTSRSWMLLVQDGERGEDGIGQRGPRGIDGAEAVTDLELVFLESAMAGQVVRADGDGKCSISNALSFYTSRQTIGLAVANTQAGHRGKVRTIGPLVRRNWAPIVGEESLCPGVYYALDGLGLLSPNPCNVAMYVSMGLAIKSDTLLIQRYQTYIKSSEDVKAPCLSTLLKGSPVRLATADSVDVPSMPDNWDVAGVLMDDVIAGGEATYRRNTTITRDDWSALLESGDTLLVPDQSYYLSDVPGKYTTDSVDRYYIGKAKNTKSLKITVGDSTPNYTLTV